MEFIGGGSIVYKLVHLAPCDERTNHDGSCFLEDWVENCPGDLIHGEIAIPVRVEWAREGEAPELHIAAPATEEVAPQPIHMRWVADGNDPELEENPVPDVPCWLECEADHPDAVPFWKDDPEGDKPITYDDLVA